MPGADLYARVINWPGPIVLSAMFIIGAVLIIAATFLVTWDRWRNFGRALGIAGVLLVMLTLFDIHQQTVTETPSSELTVIRYKFRESTRFQIRVALISLPIAAFVVAASILVSGNRRRLLQVPNHLRVGLRHFYNREYDEALREYDQAIAISPLRGESYLQRGCVHAAKGSIVQAIADFDKAVAYDPRLATAFLNRGRLRIQTNELGGALEDFERALILKPNDPAAHLNRGICYLKLSQFPQAVSDFERVLKLTNHTDFAEPANRYLSELGSHSAAPPRQAAFSATPYDQPAGYPKGPGLVG